MQYFPSDSLEIDLQTAYLLDVVYIHTIMYVMLISNFNVDYSEVTR